MGLYYEDFNVGDVYTTPRRTVTEADVMLFAGLTGDYNPLHTDAHYAATTIFGERVAHGLLGLSMLTGLTNRLGIMDGTIIALLGINWNFKAPIKFGDTIYGEMRVQEKRETSKPDRGVVVRYYALKNQRDEVVQDGTFTALMKRRPTA